MIDIHSHILPSIDDGAKNMSESIHMAREAVKEGIHTIIATPHHMNGKYINEKEKILREVNQLNQALKNESIPLTVLPGQETRIYGELLLDLDTDKILGLNQTPYLFIELPSGNVPRYTEKLLFDLQLRGLTPVIVHPERNQGIIENPDILYNLVSKGALAQITASSVSGYFGKKIKKFSEQLIEANLIHFVASDAHNTHNRTFNMNETFTLLEEQYGVDFVYYFTENAALMVEGKHVAIEAPEKVKTRKKFLGIF